MTDHQTDENAGILIVGGGIGGLTLALALHRRGTACTVFEAAPEFRPLGVGINMLPHAIRELTALGLEPALEAHGVEAREFAYFNRHGQKIFTEPCGRFAGYDYPHFSIHRADLHKVLFDTAVERLGADAIFLDHRCAGVEQTETDVTIHFDNQPSRTGAIVIACDGFHSTIRRQFYPDEGEPHFGGINMRKLSYLFYCLILPPYNQRYFSFKRHMHRKRSMRNTRCALHSCTWSTFQGYSSRGYIHTTWK